MEPASSVIGGQPVTMVRFGRTEFRLGQHGGLFLVGAVLVACAASSPPKVIHEDEALSVRLIADSRAEAPHGHPIHLGEAQMARILGGVRVLKEAREGVPAFSREEMRVMIPFLIQAFDAAAPGQLVTFHLAFGQAAEPVSRRAVTSGGLFVEDERFYVILANYRTKPFGDPLEGSIISGMDVRSDPLMPISPGGYVLGFSPPDARVQAGDKRGSWGYIDQRKVLVIDLARFFGKGAE